MWLIITSSRKDNVACELSFTWKYVLMWHVIHLPHVCWFDWGQNRKFVKVRGQKCNLAIRFSFCKFVGRCLISHLRAVYVWFFVFVRCLFTLLPCWGVHLIWIGKSISFNYWFTQWLSLPMMQIWRHEYSGHFDFITLFVGISKRFMLLT
jgi:hypothetical protein